jgi:hypothetical protein
MASRARISMAVEVPRMNKVMIVMIAAVLLPGCGLATGPISMVYSHPDFVDVSTSKNVATIRGGTLHGVFGTVKCWIEEPAEAMMLKIDAGPADITAECWFMMEGEGGDRATFSFTAIAGQEYRVRRRQFRGDRIGIELVDDTGNIVTERPKAIDLSMGETALVTHSVGYGYGVCSPTKDKVWGDPFSKSNRNIIVDAGPVTIYATCHKSGFLGPKKKRASFDLVAEAGHTYMVADEGKKCGSLLDITFEEESLIACEPFEENK